MSHDFFTRSGLHRRPRQLLALLAIVTLARADLTSIQWRAVPSLPGTIGVAAPFTGVSHDALLVAGGANFSHELLWEGGVKVWHDEIYSLKDPAAGWEIIGRLPRPLAYGVSATHGNSVICVGGSDRQRHYSDAFRIEIRDREIRIHPLPSLPRTMANGAGAMLNGKLYIVAGTRNPDDSAAMRAFWVMDLTRMDAGWRELPAWPGPARIYPVAGVQDGAFFLFSGLEISPSPAGGVVRRHLRDGYRFDPATEVWTRTADLPRPAAAAPTPLIAMDQSTLVIPGGDDGTIVDFKPLNEHPGFNRTMLAYHTDTDTWRTVGEIPAPRVTTPTVQWRGLWIIPSGEVSPGVRSPEVWALTAAGIKSPNKGAPVEHR